jgi:hypothetical protein
MRGIRAEYRTCVEICANADNSSMSNVRRNNRAVKRMYAIVCKAEAAGTISELFPLLDEPESSRWLAHQLIECATVDEVTARRCFKIVEALAAGDGPEGIGNRIWLKRHR